MRKAAVISWLCVLLATVLALFWHTEWVYNLPTPVPAHYHNVQPGAPINVTGKLPFKTNRPIFLHFFNPDCPCSRFNIPHFKSLVNKYGNDISFVIVPLTHKKFTADEILNKFDMHIPVVFDTTLATLCGVYSTPQAALIDTSGRLFFRGNYNRSRYCSNTRTEYARMAIDKILHHNAAIIFDQFALKAYGCQLPKCTKQ